MRRLLIDGQLVDPGRHYPSLNPATGSVIEEAPDATIEHAETAIRAARHAFDETDWSTELGETGRAVCANSTRPCGATARSSPS